jgi:hypothetical protein
MDLGGGDDSRVLLDAGGGNIRGTGGGATAA